eukprot:jgi/Mesen1/1994/ME000147S01088
MAGSKAKSPGAKGKAGSIPPKGKAAGSTSTAAEQGPSVEDLFSKLEGHIKKDEFTKIAKTSEEILKLAPGDDLALHCQVVALIQGGHVADALKAIEAAEKKSAPLHLNFEKAYCLYRSNRLAEALEALAAVAERTPGVVQLEAQVLYRMGNSAASIARYEELAGGRGGTGGRLDPAAASTEVKTNQIAAYVSAGRAREVAALLPALRVAPRDSFDVAYNVACALVETREVGQEMLIEEELTPDEMAEELAPISVQLAYVQQMQGRAGEAVQSYSALLKRRLADAPSMAVACNNLVALRGSKDLFDSLKRMDKLVAADRGSAGGGALSLADGLDAKLSARQKEALLFNRCLLLLHSHKLDQATRKVLPHSEAPLLLSAAIQAKEGRPAGSAARQVAPQEEQSSGGRGWMRAQLVKAQAAAAGGAPSEAAQLLESISALRHRPAVVATLVALKERAGDVAGAEATLDDAVRHYDSQGPAAMEVDVPGGEGEEEEGEELGQLGAGETKSRGEVKESLLQELAAFKLRCGKFQEAAEVYKRLLEGASSPAVKAEALTGLVSSTAVCDPAAAEKYELELPPMPGTASLDAAALERSASAQPFSRAKRPAPSAAAAAGGDGEGAGGEGNEAVKARKKRKKKKVIYPKGFDPANPGPPPDPERWLPRKERSTYKPKRKDKRIAAQIRGAQGAVIKEKPGEGGSGAAASKGPGAKAPGPAAAAAAAKAEPAAAKKKGKKGRR